MLVIIFGSFASQATSKIQSLPKIDTLIKDSITVFKTDTISRDTVINLKKNQPIKSKIRYSAKDSIVYDITGKQVFLYNGAEVYYEDITLKSDFVRIDQDKKIVYAEGVKDSTGNIVGKPVFTDNGQTYNSDFISYNFETKKGKIKEVTTQEGEGYLLANDVKKNEFDEIFIKNGKYTTCNLPHPHFYIALTKAKNTKNKTVSGPAYLVVEDVPLPLALPFGFFPRKSGRSSGILLPEVGEDRILGFFLRNGGYYFGINDYLDLALRGDIYSKGSYGFNTFSRYNVLYRFNGNLAAGYTNRQIGEPETIGFEKQNDFYLRWNHSQDAKARPGTRFSSNVNVASRNNFRNGTNSNIQSIVQNSLSSSISYSKYWIGTPFNLSGSLSHDQNLQTGQITLGLPRMSFNVARINPFDSKKRIGAQRWYHKIGFSYSLDAENRVDTYDSLLFEPNIVDKFKNGIRHTIPVATSFNILKHINVNPSFNYAERWYFSSIEKIWNGNQVIIDTIIDFKQAREYSLGASANTRLYGMFQLNKLGIIAVRHVLTPSVSYSYRPDFSDEKYGYYKKVQIDTAGTSGTYSIFEQSIYGSPGSGKSSILGFGIDNNLEMKVRTKNDTASSTKKIKLFENLRVSSSYNMAIDSLQLAPISVSARTVILNKINIDFNASYDPYVLYKDTSGVITRVNQFEWDKNKRIGRLVSANFSLGTNLNAEAFRKKRKEQPHTTNKYDRLDVDFVDRNPEYFVDWTIPWSLNINYILNYSRPLHTKTITQSLNFSGDLSITEKWKVGFTSGYDFKSKEITPTSLSIYRDLHCWDLSINWIPFGTYQRYSVDLKVRASILQDLKLSRRREYYER